ncbi:hypothetical protein MSAN_02058100 [Mycena sanguinolenta]|uniref:Uncharacterized protein n=1 Tax=Mycena sanguinolenta TaxID=230812 RepID=A0A8H7CMP8_9AGAR|nr:hypothetical protein MSAN_02058100 [Mycena sanguinolenta]
MESQPQPASPSSGFRSIPCSGVDLGSRHLVHTIGLVINARLDPHRLQATLWQLVEHRFPRAGARLAFRNGVYELQIPEQFDSESPPFVFTVQEYPEIYSGSGRPEIPNVLTGSEPCITPDPELETFFHSPTCPKTPDEFVQHSAPLLHIHVSVFEDLTFLGFLAPHAVFDAVGARTLLDAWTRLLRGEDIHSIPGMAWDAQPFAPFESGPVNVEVQRGWFKADPPLRAQDKREDSPAELDPKDVRRFVRVPKTFLQDAKTKIMDELRAEESGEYVGSGDVLTAWWLKTLYDRRSLVDHTPVHVHVLKNLRDLPVFANDAPLKDPYIHNAISTIPVPPIPAGAFQMESLGMLALRIRRSILAYKADPEAIRADLRWCCAEASRYEVISPCPPGAEHSFQTDWRAAKLADLDFTGAVVGNEGMKTTAHVVFVYPLLCTVLKPYRRGVSRVVMDDADAVWMCETRGEKDWEGIRQAGGVAFTDSSSV